MGGYTKKTPPSSSGNRITQYATPVSGVKRPAEQYVSVTAAAPADARQAKFRRLIGDGESKDLDSYRYT